MYCLNSFSTFNPRGFPNSLIESMKEGLIPFATNAGDSQYFTHSGRGIKLKPSSDSIYESIAFAIDTLQINNYKL